MIHIKSKASSEILMKVLEGFLPNFYEVHGLDSSMVRWDYSGRGMYGRLCVGFVIPANLKTHLIVKFANQIVEERRLSWFEDEVAYLNNLETCLINCSTDDMGKDIIVYLEGVMIDSKVVPAIKFTAESRL